MIYDLICAAGFLFFAVRMSGFCRFYAVASTAFWLVYLGYDLALHRWLA